MKILKKEKINPIQLLPGDTIRLSYKEEVSGIFGKEIIREEKVLEHTVDKVCTFDEAVIFELENGEIEGWSEGLGGAFGKRA